MTDPLEFGEADGSEAQRQRTKAINDLAASSELSNQTMHRLMQSVRDETSSTERKVAALEKQNKQTRMIIYLVCLGIMGVLVVAVINAVNLNKTRKNQDQLVAVAASVDQANKTLLDCVNSTGECGRINSENQARILDTVKQYELTVIYCARTNPQPLDPDGTKFIKCVNTLYPGGPSLNTPTKAP